MADIFVSYTSRDRDWAFWIGKELQRLKHQPRIHEWEIEGGGDVPAWMEERLQKADRVLCVISAEYLTKDYSGWERRSAQWAAASNRPKFMLPVFVEDCEAPVAMAHIKRCKLFGLSEDDTRLALQAYLAEAKPPEGPVRFPGGPWPAVPTSIAETISFPGKHLAVSNIPISLPRHFLGRDAALEAINAALKRDEGRIAIAVLHGLRGVGKTTLSAAYAELHRADYRATWWIRAQTEATMRDDLIALGIRRNWVLADEKEEPALRAVRERLRDEGEGTLLIYDNAIDAASLKPFLPPSGRAHVLVTSNAHAWRGVAELVEIEVWPKSVGADYLIARTGRYKERSDAEALSEVLGGLPLAHEQVAAYCERLEVPFVEYARRFSDAPARLLDAEKDAPTEYHHKLTAAKAFALAIDGAAKLHLAAEPLIVHAALLAPEPIPLFLFCEGRQALGEPLATLLAGDGLDETVAALRAFALVDREAISDERDPALTTDTIRLHRLIRIAATARRPGDQLIEEARHSLIGAMATVYPSEAYSDPTTWPRARRLDALATGLLANSNPPRGTEETAAHLLVVLGRYRHWVQGDLTGARLLLERALAIREKVLGPEHPDTAASLNHLANLLRTQGDRASAQPLLERALAIREKVLGPEHPDTARSLNNLALLLKSQGDLVLSRSLLERALAIREKEFGTDHPSTAASLNNLANLFCALEDRVTARPLLERALAIREKVLGPEHLDTARSLNNFANLLRAQGDRASARPLLERALAIREKMLGPEHPDTARSLSNLANLLRAQGDRANARPLLERALAICEKTFGPEHPNTARSLNNLAKLLRAQGDLAGAQFLIERANAIRKCSSIQQTADQFAHFPDN